jgi:hypothetical protein
MARYFRRITVARPCTHVVHPCQHDRDADARKLLPDPRARVREMPDRLDQGRHVPLTRETQGVPE